MAHKALSASCFSPLRQIHSLACVAFPLTNPAKQLFLWRNVSVCVQCQPQRPFSTPSQQPIFTAPIRRALTTRALSSTAPQRENDKPTFPPSKPAQGPSKLAHRLEHLTAQLLESLSAISHRLNIYTGTDYTPISTVRTGIATQETAIREAHTAVAAAKAAHASAQATQSASQKEVVQLLERKHSWSGGDLERYMALIRSEHVNEQAVAAASADAAAAERALEEHRAALERLERQMYHEEQIWSDTIRRNSTWVTFALMGVNLLLLVGNVVLVEPWRRRRMVAEIKGVVDDKTVGVVPASAPVSPLLAEEDIQAAAGALGASAMEAEAEAEAAALPLPAQAADAQVEDPTAGVSTPGILSLAFWTSAAARFQHDFLDLFSARPVTLRKVDATAATLSGAAAGASSMLFVLWAAGALIRDFY